MVEKLTREQQRALYERATHFVAAWPRLSITEARDAVQAALRVGARQSGPREATG